MIGLQNFNPQAQSLNPKPRAPKLIASRQSDLGYATAFCSSFTAKILIKRQPPPQTGWMHWDHMNPTTVSSYTKVGNIIVISGYMAAIEVHLLPKAAKASNGVLARFVGFRALTCSAEPGRAPDVSQMVKGSCRKQSAQSKTVNPANSRDSQDWGWVRGLCKTQFSMCKSRYIELQKLFRINPSGRHGVNRLGC